MPKVTAVVAEPGFEPRPCPRSPAIVQGILQARGLESGSKGDCATGDPGWFLQPSLDKGQPSAWAAFVSPAYEAICLIVCIYPAQFTFLFLITLSPCGPRQDIWLDV